MGKRKRNEDEAGARQSGSGSGSGSSPSLTRKDISQCIRNSILSSFGIASAGMAQDLQGNGNLHGMVGAYCLRAALTIWFRSQSAFMTNLRNWQLFEYLEIHVGLFVLQSLFFRQFRANVSLRQSFLSMEVREQSDELLC